MFSKVLTILASFFLVANVLQADMLKSFHESKLSKLNGITDIGIIVCIDNEFMNETKLSEKRVENLIALKFRQSGIKLSNDSDNTFIINVRFAKAYCCATYVETELWDVAHIKRTGKSVITTIWKDSTLTSGGTGQDLGQSILSKIEAFADEFLNLYLEANPREFIHKPIVN